MRVYLHRAATSQLSFYLQKEISRAYLAARPTPAWNIAKLHADQFAISFLSYPDFENDPHPALAEATKINLNTGSMVRTDYRGRANPPILHRKETFLDKSDARAASFAALTKQEEEAGLYRDPSRIGLRMQWLTLLERLNFSYEGHLKNRYRSADIRPGDHLIFDIGGNRYRLFVQVYYQIRIVRVVWVGTHAEYDRKKF